MEATIPITTCKRWLATIWFSGAGIVFFIMLVQSLLGRYGDQVDNAWGWLMPTVVPTLSLIIGVLVYDAVDQLDIRRRIDQFLFRLTAGLSCAYLLAVLLVLLLTPLSSLGPLELMSRANAWLGPLQGLVAAAMGAFFVKAAREGPIIEDIQRIEAAQAVKAAQDERADLAQTKVRPSGLASRSDDPFR